MLIWLITVGEPLPVATREQPRLMRTGTLALRLARGGHDVVWWTSAFDHFQKQHLSDRDSTVAWEGGIIRMLRSVGYRRNVSLGRLFDHADIARKFRQYSRSEPRPDVILASLPTIELAREAVRVGVTQRVPVLVDVRDLWPDVFLHIVPPHLRWFGRWLVAPLMRDATFALANCTGIVGISEGYLRWALNRAGRERRADDAVIPLGYVPPLSAQNDLSAARDRLAAIGVDPSKKLCWYIGTFGRQYDLAPVLKSASRLLQAGRKDLQFVISGDGELRERWQRLVGPSEHIVFTGWIGGSEINWLRAHAAIGLQPYVTGAPQGLANKLFEYLSAGIPVVSSLPGENQRLIEQHECGVTYRAGDELDCLNKITMLADNDDLRGAMGQRAKQLFLHEFSEEVVFDGLATHLESVVERHNGNEGRARRPTRPAGYMASTLSDASKPR